MTRRGRLALLALGAGGLLAVLIVGFLKLPAFGQYNGVYGAVVDRVELPARHATDLVTALNFDIRGFDTLGEEYILFASVAGVALLLRKLRDESEEEQARGIEDHGFAGASSLLRLTSLILIPLLIALGCYLVLHGQLTPGGGFQGGVVLAAGPIAVLLAGRYLAVKRIAPEWAVEALEAAGAAGYTLMGIGGLVGTGIFFQNFLPLGVPGMLLSAGQMPINSIAVGVEVTGAFLITWTEFLDQSLIGEPGTAAHRGGA